MEWIRRRSRAFIAVTVFTGAVIFLRLGSFEDRIVVGVLWLSLVVLPVERYVHDFAPLIAKFESLRYILLSSIGPISAWASAPFRGGGGPFHLQLAGIWRGYPFPFEEWWWSQGGLSEITWHREFHLLGFIGDVLIPAAVFLFILRWLRRSRAAVDGIRTLLFVGFTTAFTWLNIEPWLGGLLLSIAGPPPPPSPVGIFLKRRSHARLSADLLERLYLRTTVPVDRGKCRHWLERMDGFVLGEICRTACKFRSPDLGEIELNPDCRKTCRLRSAPPWDIHRLDAGNSGGRLGLTAQVLQWFPDSLNSANRPAWHQD
jgi:hypothetical protein